MIALGWCLANQILPDPLFCAGDGGVVVACAPSSSGTSARDRLGLLQRAFDAGVDIAPLSAARAWPVKAAVETAILGVDDLLQQLSFIRGHGQLTLRADWPVEDFLPINGLTGRDWIKRLRDRQAAWATRAEMAREVLHALCADLDVSQRPLRQEGTGFELHLMIQRSNLPDCLVWIRTAAQRCVLPNGGSVTVSGLWPPFGFVHSPQCPEQVSS
jgi:hypothetical protein